MDPCCRSDGRSLPTSVWRRQSSSAPAYISAAGRLDTWTLWAYPVTLSTAVLLAAVLTRLARVLAGAGALAVIYAAVVALPLAVYVPRVSSIALNSTDE